MYAATVFIQDETTLGETIHRFPLRLVSEKITVRELIKRRIQSEVEEYNRTLPEVFNGFIQPTEAERLLNGFKVKEKRKIDWQDQFEKAVQAFEHNGFVLIVNDRQMESLDQGMVLTDNSVVTFLKLVPLVGG